MDTSRLAQALRSNDSKRIACALRSLDCLTADDVRCLAEWIRRNARRWKYSRQRRPRKEDTYIAAPGVERSKFDELAFALVRNHPEDVAKYISSDLHRAWICDIARWIERYFGPSTRGRPKLDPMTQTLQDTWLKLKSKERPTIQDAAVSLGWVEPDRAASNRERGPYSGVSPRTLKRARSRIRSKKQ
jgi:hypothetical protein